MKISRKLKMIMPKRLLKTIKKFSTLRSKSMKLKLKLSCMCNTEIEKRTVNKLVNKDNTIRSKMS